jgi:hypothetical protein
MQGQQQGQMSTKAREFIDFWIENSVHAAEEYGAAGAEQGSQELARRCVEMAASQGLSRADLENEVGDLVTYLRERLKAANELESGRSDRPRS